MNEDARAALEAPSDDYNVCKTGCGTILTDSYVDRYGRKCPDCRREVGSKIYWALYGPGRATKGL